MDDPSEILKKVHGRMMNGMQGKEGSGPSNETVQAIVARDQNLRKAIADLYMLLEQVDDRRLAVELLAEHITMMVEMMNHFKGGAGSA